MPINENLSGTNEVPGETTAPPAQPDPTTSERITNIRANANGISGGGGPTPGSLVASVEVKKTGNDHA